MSALAIYAWVSAGGQFLARRFQAEAWPVLQRLLAHGSAHTPGLLTLGTEHLRQQQQNQHPAIEGGSGSGAAGGLAPGAVQRVRLGVLGCLQAVCTCRSATSAVRTLTWAIAQVRMRACVITRGGMHCSNTECLLCASGYCLLLLLCSCWGFISMEQTGILLSYNSCMGSCCKVCARFVLLIAAVLLCRPPCRTWVPPTRPSYTRRHGGFCWRSPPSTQMACGCYCTTRRTTRRPARRWQLCPQAAPPPRRPRPQAPRQACCRVCPGPRVLAFRPCRRCCRCFQGLAAGAGGARQGRRGRVEVESSGL